MKSKRFGCEGLWRGGIRAWLGLGAAVALAAGCAAPTEPMSSGDPEDPLDEQSAACQGDNLGGSNLGGTNLAGTNLAGTNLGGANLGGNNLGGTNLAGTNLAGTNLGGNNLGGNNLAGTNLAGTNLAGTNLGGNNLAGTNLAGTNLAGTNLGGNNLAGTNLGGSNLGGSNLAGTNLGGNNLAGTNLAGTNLAGTNSGKNIHNLSGSIGGMLYSGEDLMTKTSQRIVLGVGSTAFAKLLGEQSANAKMYTALGKLPWGFATSSGGPKTLDAWEAVVWGDKSYNVFVLAAPPGTPWSGVAGFIKAVFRWNASSTQAMDISAIDASASIDPTANMAITTYTGMMNAATKHRAGGMPEQDFVAGELAFITATTNNQSVQVDFASWARDNNDNAVVLGNVQSSNPPTYAEALYYTVDNGNGTVAVILDDAMGGNPQPPGITNSVGDLAKAYRAWQSGLAAKPIPLRCNGALVLNTIFGEPVPFAKCDNGLQWTNAYCHLGDQTWSNVAGTTAPMNQYMMLTKAGGAYKRGLVINGSCTAKPVLSETYMHMWGKSYDLNRAWGGIAASTGSACSTAEAVSKVFDSQYAQSNMTKFCTGQTPSSTAPTSIMYTFPAGKAYAVNSYALVSANDYQERDPKDWKLQGCNGSCMVGSDSGWVSLDTRSGQVFDNRYQSNTYSFSNGIAYSQIRLRVTATYQSTTRVQLAELMLFDGNPGPSAGQSYTLVGKGSKKCLEVPNGSTANGAQMQIWSCVTGNDNQEFAFQSTGAGFSLKNAASGNCLDVPGGSATSGLQLQQYTCNSTTSQIFKFVPVGSGYYKIVNVANGLCVDVRNAGTSSGTAVQQVSCNGGDAQAWLLQ